MGQLFDPTSQNRLPPEPQQPPSGWAPQTPGWAGTPDQYQQPNAPIPVDHRSPYAPSAAPTPGPRRPWGAAALGLVVGLLLALGFGGVLVATKTVHLGSATATADGRAVVLPDTLCCPTYRGPASLVVVSGSISGTSTAEPEVRTSRAAALAGNQDKVGQLTEAAYRRADPGSGFGYRQYATKDLRKYAAVIAVRAQHPGLTIGPVADPAYLGLAVALERIEVVGTCSAQWSSRERPGSGSRLIMSRTST